MNAQRLPLRLGVTVLLTLASTLAARGQVVPATPKKFTTRTTGGGSSTGTASVGFTAQKPQTTVRTTIYFALGDARQWKSTDGKSLLGKLIAFEDLVVETKLDNHGQPTPAAPPAMPDKPTVVRDGKARLLIDTKPFEVSLDRLSEEDRKLVEGIQSAVNAKAKSKQ